MAKGRKKKARRRASRSRIVLRWLALGGVALVAVLYVQPLRTYLDTRNHLMGRQSEVDKLRAERDGLQKRLALSTSTTSLSLEARRLGYVKPGEHLFIVKGIAAWRRAQNASSIAPSG
jgi:cell division protein FtsB